MCCNKITIHNVKNDNILDRLICLCFLGIVVTYPFSINFNSVFIISVTLLVIFKFFKYKSLVFSYLFIFLFLFFLTRLFSLIYTNDIQSGVRIMMRSMSLIAFPIIMMFQGKALPSKVVIIQVLFIATTIACIYCLIGNFVFFLRNDTPVNLWLDWRYNNYHLSEHLSFGANYFTLLIIINIVNVFFCRKNIHIVYILGVVIQIFFAVLLSSRGLLLVLAFFVVFASLYMMFKRFKLVGLITAILLLTSFFYGIYNTVPVLRQRYFKTYEELVSQGSHENKVGGIVTRKKKIDASLTIIKKNYFFGVGIGDVRDELTAQFVVQNFQEGVNKWYDSHNQYLESFMASGIFGFLSFFLIFFFCLYHAYVYKDYHFFIIIMVFGLYGVLESFMETHKGIVLFCMILTYLVANNIRTSKKVA